MSLSRQRKRLPDPHPDLARARPRGDRPERGGGACAEVEGDAILRLVDELASFAADLWLAGKLADFPLHEEERDAEAD